MFKGRRELSCSSAHPVVRAIRANHRCPAPCMCQYRLARMRNQPRWLCFSSLFHSDSSLCLCLYLCLCFCFCYSHNLSLSLDFSYNTNTTSSSEHNRLLSQSNEKWKNGFPAAADAADAAADADAGRSWWWPDQANSIWHTHTHRL